MSAIVIDRHSYRREVETLLEQIRREVRELQRLRAAGVRGPGLSERKHRLAGTRERLAAVVGQRA
ncbi:MAG TPA: hypothetical protein VLN26_17980 [Gaiellaceae bacterium]|nr:hypothetical protein [Gaiellaceae bacterium]